MAVLNIRKPPAFFVVRHRRIFFFGHETLAKNNNWSATHPPWGGSGKSQPKGAPNLKARSVGRWYKRRPLIRGVGGFCEPEGCRWAMGDLRDSTGPWCPRPRIPTLILLCVCYFCCCCSLRGKNSILLTEWPDRWGERWAERPHRPLGPGGKRGGEGGEGRGRVRGSGLRGQGWVPGLLREEYWRANRRARGVRAQTQWRILHGRS